MHIRKPPIGGSHFDMDRVASPRPYPRHLMQLRFACCGRSIRPKVQGFNQQGVFDKQVNGCVNISY